MENSNDDNELEKLKILEEISKELTDDDAAAILRFIMKRTGDIVVMNAFMDEDNKYFNLVATYDDKDSPVHNKLDDIIKSEFTKFENFENSDLFNSDDIDEEDY